MPLRVSVRDLDELKAVVLALKAMGKDLRRDINRATTQTMGPEWKAAIAARASTAQDRRVLVPGARIASGNPPAARAATSRRRLSGGLVPSESWRAFEFGSKGDRRTTYTRRNRSGSGSHRVTRNTTAQLPARAPKGRVVYPAFADLGPRMVALWVQLVARKAHEAFEGRR